MAETVKQNNEDSEKTSEIEAQRYKAESSVNVIMESESTEQDVVLRGNEDPMTTSNTSTNDGTCNTNGCAKKTVSVQEYFAHAERPNYIALH